MNFRDLEYVVTVAETLNFTQAAQDCHVSQPSLSNQIRKLEEELGEKIFLRNKRNVQLTVYGVKFVEKAHDILDAQASLYDLAREKEDPLAGRLRMGAIMTVAPYLCPSLIAALEKVAPRLEVSLKEGKTEDLVRLLLANKLDCAVVSLPTDEHIFESRALMVDPYLLALSPHYKGAFSGELAHGHIPNKLDLILLEEGHCFREQALDVCQSMKARESRTFNASSLETIRKYLLVREGATLIPSIARDDHDGLHYIPLAAPGFQREIGVIWSKNSLVSDRMHPILDSLIPNWNPHA